MATGVARLRRVRRVRFPHRDTHFEGFVLDASGKTRERSVVETPVHPLPVVEMLADVRQAFEHDNRVLEGLVVFDRFAGRLLHDVREGVLVVIYAPLGSVTLLKSLERGIRLFCGGVRRGRRRRWTVELEYRRPSGAWIRRCRSRPASARSVPLVP